MRQGLSAIGLALLFPVHADAALSKPDWFSGRIYTDHYFGLVEPNSGEFIQNSFSLWLGVDTNLASTVSLRAITQLDVLPKSIERPNEMDSRLRVREAYMNFEPIGGLQIRAGQEIIPWGKSDGVNPTDYLTGKDFTLLNPDDEVRRVGAVGAHLSYTPKSGNSPLLFEVVVQGNYVKNQMLIPTSAVPSGITLNIDRDAPDVSAENAQGAVKISYLGTAFDFSLSYFDGREKFPQFFYDGGSTITAKNIFIHVVGGDFSTTVDQYVFRLEGAYTMSEFGPYGYKNLGITEPDHLDIVAGAERPIGDDFRAQAQFLVRHHPKYASAESYSGSSLQDTLVTRQVAAANALILNFQKKTRPGVTLRAGYVDPGKNWSADLNWIGNFDSSDYFFQPKVSWMKIENVKMTLGADLYGGESNRPFGALSGYNAVFFDAKYFF